jgi:signal transduction histidine kinase
MDPQPLIDRLAAHRTIGSVPREQLAWLAEVGVEEIFEPGEIFTPVTGPVRAFYVILDGRLTIKVDSGSGPRQVMEWRGGDVTGILPYSRVKAPPGSVIAQERTRVLAIDPVHFPRMIRECTELTAVLVHVMLDRARAFKSSELLDEKMASLGRLAAGLAHELNNPASAVARSAQTLVIELSILEEATKRFCALKLSDHQCTAIAAFGARLPAAPLALPPLERADRQDAIEGWLDEHDVVGVNVAPLAESGFGRSDLDELSASVGVDKVGTVLAQLAAAKSVSRLAADVHTAASRIHTLVAAVKGFTYVNQQATLQPIAIGRGLSDTITVLRSKARMKSVEVDLVVPDNLPAVEGYGGELNQVWANLVDNAIDAAPGGHVQVNAEAAAGKVVVRVIDDGPGISPEVAKRIFDPFFTTKEIGQGTGLGLDIARRIVQRHHGEIDVTTDSGRTEFRVTLPAVVTAADAHVTD